jgi:hypothetical protein
VTLPGAERSATGWEPISETFRWLASRSSPGELRMEIIAAGASGDLACTVG